MDQSSATHPVTGSGWQHWGTLPVAAAVLVLLNGLYIALVAFGNITDYGTNQPFVQHVLKMDTTNFGAEPGTNLDPDVMWRAIESTAIQNIAYVGIIIWETLTALILLAAGYQLLRAGSDTIDRARSLATIGLLMLLLLFFGGFIAIGGEWFQMWKSAAWNGLDPAFRNSVLALGTMILVHLPSPQWSSSS
jgi:predicted small integral membrane protein